MDSIALNPVRHPDRFYIGGQWVTPSSDAELSVFDASNEELYFRVAEAQAPDVARAVGAAREAFDEGAWPRMSHSERGAYLQEFAKLIRQRSVDVREVWPREAGALERLAVPYTERAAGAFAYYAGFADSYPFEEVVTPTAGGEFGLLVREPVGVVGAIIPWNAPIVSIAQKLAPALMAGCTVVLKSPPDAPGEGLIMAEVAEELGLPPGVFNVITADREVSELLVRDPRVDKISFTGSTAAGRRIGMICGERIARCSLELGGKSAAVILDDADLTEAASALSASECSINGQVCASLTRIIVSQHRHDELVEALASKFSSVVVGSPFDASSELGPLATERQRERVERYINLGREEGARLVTGGGRPKDLDRGYYVEPTIFADVNNSSTIAQEEIFGPVLSVIPVANEQEAIRVSNDTIYGLNASVFTPDVDRARYFAAQLRSGTVGHNAFRLDFGIAFGGFKQSGIGREGGKEAMLLFTEPKTVILNEVPSAYRAAGQPG